MANLAINQNLLNNYARPNLSQAKKYINNAKEQSKSLKIPTTFVYKKFLQSLFNNLSTVEQNINQIDNKIVVTIDSLNKIEQRTQSKTRQISSILLSSSIGISSNNINTGIKTVGKATNKVVSVLNRHANMFNQFLSNTKSKIVNGAKSILSKTGDFISKAKKKAENAIDALSNTASKVGKTISGWGKSAWNWISNTAAPSVWDALKRTGASIANFVISVVKGLSQFVETLVDLVAMVGVGVASIGTGLWDAGQAIYGKITGKEWHSATKSMWKATMGYVAEDHVGSAFDKFYKNNSVGKWLDNNAYAPFRSDGIACQIGSGLGYVAGLVILTIATLGIGTAATGAATLSTVASTAISATVVGTTTFSSTVASTWKDMRDQSWEGIENSYKNGEIDKDTYDQYEQIHNMNDSDWNQVEELYKSGQLGKDEYDMIKSIREIPDEWKTMDNFKTGMKKGSWEGGKAAVITAATMGLGNKLSGVLSNKLPSLLSKLPKNAQPVLSKLLGNVVEETSESAIEFGGELVTSKGSFNNALDNTGGVAGNALNIALGVLLDIDLPGKRKMKLDVDIPGETVKSAIDPDSFMDKLKSKINKKVISNSTLDDIDLEIGRVNTDIDINKDEWYKLYQVSKSDDYKHTMDYAKKGYAQDLSNMNYYSNVESNMNKLKNDMDTLLAKKAKLENTKIGMQTKENLSNLTYRKNSTVKEASARLESNINRFKYNNTNEFEGLNDQILDNGLYHFTGAADAILDSGYIKATGELNSIKGLKQRILGESYGKAKTFFFSGVPEIGAFATNIDNIPLKAEAVKVNPTREMLDSSKFRIRNLDDGAITFDGRFNLDGTKATKEYFCIVQDGDKLVYKNVSKDFYDSYENSAAGKQINEFLKNKSNVSTIKTDYLCNLSYRNSQAKVAKKVHSILTTTVDTDVELKKVKSNISEPFIINSTQKTQFEVNALPQNGVNLKQKFYSNIPEKLTEIEKAKLLYTRLNDEVNYSSKYIGAGKLGQTDIVSDIYHQKIDLENFDGRDIVCSNWSEMYQEMLNDNGIESYIRGHDDKHKWVVFKSNEKYYFADSSNIYLEMNDLTRQKLGLNSIGFVEINEQQFMSETFAYDMSKYKADYMDLVSSQQKEMKKIDKHIGNNVEDITNLFGKSKTINKNSELKHLGLNNKATTLDIISAKMDQRIMNKVDKLGVAEGVKTFGLYKNIEFTSEELRNISQEWLISPNGEFTVLYKVKTPEGSINYAHLNTGNVSKMTDVEVNNLKANGYKKY